jgi:HlyD family secretion protein
MVDLANHRNTAEPVAPDPKLVAVLGTDSKSRRRRWVGRALVLLVLLALVAAGVVWWRSRGADAGPKWVMAEVKRGDIQVTLTATGTLAGVKTVEVGAEVSGKVVEVRVDFNDHVKKGDVLAIIDPLVFKAAVEQAAAQVADSAAAIRTARATVNETRQNRARAEEQEKLGLISKRDLEAARAAAERAEAQLAGAEANAVVAQANLNSAKTKLDKTTIVAPIDGIVLARMVEPGQTVTAGFNTPLLFKVTEDLKRMKLTAYIDEADVGRAKEGQQATFTVDAYPGRTFPATVLSVRNEPKTEQNVVSYESVLSVDNGELLLRPGMTATATIVSEKREKVLTVPNAALRFSPPRPESSSRGFSFGPGGRPRTSRPKARGPGVWALEDQQPKRIEVKTGASDGTVTEILSGELSDGMQVIVDTEEKK